MRTSAFYNGTLAAILMLSALTSCYDRCPDCLPECEFTGTVVDYSGLAGCGLLVRIDDGDVLEPREWPAGFTPYSGQRIRCSYQLTDLMSNCEVGPVVKITCAQELKGDTLIKDGFPFETYPNDNYIFNNAEIKDDWLFVDVAYGGGCREHDFYFVYQLPTCGTPPIPPPLIRLHHDAHSDPCEMMVYETLSLNLIPLRMAGVDSVEFHLSAGTSPAQTVVLMYYY